MGLSIYQYGHLIWMNEKGEFHREDGPAFILENGSKEY